MLRFSTLLLLCSLMISSINAQHLAMDQFDPHTKAQELSQAWLAQRGQASLANFMLYEDLIGSASALLSAPYRLDSARIEVVDPVTGLTHTKRTAITVPVNSTTQQVIYRSWGRETTNPPNFETIVEQTSTGYRLERFATDLTTNTNTKIAEIVVENDDALNQRRTTSDYFDALGNPTSSTYQLIDTTIYSNGMIRVQESEADASFTPTGFTSRYYALDDAEGRNLVYIFHYKDFAGTTPFDSTELTNWVTTYVDGTGDDYTYTKNETGYNGQPNMIETGAYTYSAGTINSTYSRMVQGGSTPISTGGSTSTLDADGNVTAITTTSSSGGVTNSSSQTYVFIPGTDLFTAYDVFTGTPPVLNRLERRFYTQQISNTTEAIPTTVCKLQAGNMGPRSFLSANAAFTGTYQLLDVQGRLLQTTTKNAGQTLDLEVPATSGLYYLIGQSATERCVTKLVR